MRALTKLATIFGVLAVGAACAGALLGCAQPTSPGVDPHALAYGAVETLSSAWVDSAQACLVVSQAQPAGQEHVVAAQCESILDPIRGSLIMAGSAINTWTVADQANFPCLLKQFVTDFEDAEIALQAMQVTLPVQEINAGLALAETFLPQCTVASDAGAQ